MDWIELATRLNRLTFLRVLPAYRSVSDRTASCSTGKPMRAAPGVRLGRLSVAKRMEQSSACRHKSNA